MSLWRLELWRITRTRRLLAIFAVYLFFGLTGPFTARYLGEILDTLGTEGIQVQFPEPVPADGIAQFTGNVTQIGLLVVVLVASAALAFDARREMAIFLRTRVNSVSAIVLPAYVVNAGTAAAGLLAGTFAAWYETVVLIGPLPAGRMVLGTALGVLFLAFAVAVVAVAAAMFRGVLATAGATLVLLLSLAILGSIGALREWLPTTLASAAAGLTTGEDPADYLRSTIVTVLATVVALYGSTLLGRRRELSTHGEADNHGRRWLVRMFRVERREPAAPAVHAVPERPQADLRVAEGPPVPCTGVLRP
jgi:ABC-2 type transport system permease protein